jgi:hypothetical protein
MITAALPYSYARLPRYPFSLKYFTDMIVMHVQLGIEH